MYCPMLRIVSQTNYLLLKIKLSKGFIKRHREVGKEFRILAGALRRSSARERAGAA
jgi:hypothetical protein